MKDCFLNSNTGKTYHIAKALNANNNKEKNKYIELAMTYQLSDIERKLVKIIEKDDFCFSHILKQLGEDILLFCLDIATNQAREEWEKDFRYYLKKRVNL